MQHGPPVVRPHRKLINAVLVAACIAFLAAGSVLYQNCNGGNSLILFGVAVAILGAILFRLGAWATAIPFAIVTLTLVGGGYYGLTIAGCAW